MHVYNGGEKEKNFVSPDKLEVEMELQVLFCGGLSDKRRKVSHCLAIVVTGSPEYYALCEMRRCPSRDYPRISMVREGIPRLLRKFKAPNRDFVSYAIFAYDAPLTRDGRIETQHQVYNAIRDGRRSFIKPSHITRHERRDSRRGSRNPVSMTA